MKNKIVVFLLVALILLPTFISAKDPRIKGNQKNTSTNNANGETITSETNNKPKPRQGPWKSLGRNSRLCNITLADGSEELLLRYKKGKFRSWMYNITTGETSRYQAYPIDWYRNKTIQRKLNRGWVLENITPDDLRVTVCNITAGEYILRLN